ncbi:ferredoxin reductase family protein [Albibacillus kandeliae]|uniref:ferredoxin reductase family protein n=1 Tax=Albibacillus kandeliae TaxID=2174228 RepID=UPI000D6968A7|nr:ferredoxin reductase family protein [Albibacillus kandeliae]
MRHIAFILAYLLVVSLPLVLSWQLGWPPRTFHQELATALGIVAFAMILVEFMLSGRFKRVSNGIGMDLTMRFHQVMARLALVFAILHPLLYQGTPADGPHPWDPTRQLTITTDLPYLATGVLGFLLLPALFLMAIGRVQLGYRYETWRLTHGVFALIIVLLVLHHAVYAGRYASQPLLTWTWIGMAGIAIGSLLVVYLRGSVLGRARPWRVRSVTQLTPRQWQVTLTPNGHTGIDFEAGQFVWLKLGHQIRPLQEHPFSICSAPASGPDVSFMIKELGDFTRAIGQIAPGTLAHIDGPFGNMTITDRSEPGVALIAGGVGLAPLLSILRQMRLMEDLRPRRLIYGNRTLDQIAYREELETEDVTHVLSEPPEDWAGEIGFIDEALLDRCFSPEEFENWLFVICGPTAMMELVEDHLLERGTPSNRILSERFAYD